MSWFTFNMVNVRLSAGQVLSGFQRYVWGAPEPAQQVPYNDEPAQRQAELGLFEHLGVTREMATTVSLTVCGVVAAYLLSRVLAMFIVWAWSLKKRRSEKAIERLVDGPRNLFAKVEGPNASFVVPFFARSAPRPQETWAQATLNNGPNRRLQFERTFKIDGPERIDAWLEHFEEFAKNEEIADWSGALLASLDADARSSVRLMNETDPTNMTPVEIYKSNISVLKRLCGDDKERLAALDRRQGHGERCFIYLKELMRRVTNSFPDMP